MADGSHLGAPLLVTPGEPAGIGGEILLKAWLAARQAPLPPFVALHDRARLAAEAQALGLNVPIAAASSPEEAGALFPTALPVLDRPFSAPVTPGKPDVRHAKAVIGAIDEAVDWALAGRVRGIVTNPIHKATCYAAGFRAPGHTEYLAQRIGERRGPPAPQPVMMLAIEGLRVVPVTVHLSLAEAIRGLTIEALVAVAQTTVAALRQDFGCAVPRLAVAALNPHAGEAGALGQEEQTIIAPAVEKLRSQGLRVEGPAPADTLFHAAARARYDAALCMYHDQALIPLKTLDFAGGVNITLGLPIVRTSPDHGTALDIAGQGRADPTSFVAALRQADAIAWARARSAARGATP